MEAKFLIRKFKSDSLIFFLLLSLPTLLFWQVVFGGKTLLPADNLLQWEPWASFADELGVSEPHNPLLSDLILENYVWKKFIIESIRERRIPLWNPYLFCGVPFLAAGQHSALYPFSILFYILPIARAYGYFTVLQLFLAGLFTYIFARVIGMGRFGAAIAAITYMLSAFMVVGVVFTMIISAAAWLPLILAMEELIIKKTPSSPIRFVIIGAIALCFHVLAGHVEITYHVLFVSVFYGAFRLAQRFGRPLRSASRPLLKAVGWLAVMVILGLALGAVQLIPLYEHLSGSFRQDSATYQQVVGWAFPKRRLISFLVPNFFGNPTHRSYFDVFSREEIPVSRNFYGEPIEAIDWGIKNYVEGRSYVGILPLLLTPFAIFNRWRRRYFWIFASLAAFSLALVFGTPLYALLYYGLPGVKQLHTPFRWIFPYTLSVAVLAGLGADKIARGNRGVRPLLLFLGWGALIGGLFGLAALLIGLFFPEVVIPLAERAMLCLAKAPQAFADGRMFFSYEFRNLFVFFLMLLIGGAILIAARPANRWLGGRRAWKPFALLFLILDLFFFGYGFNPASEPKLLDFIPPVVDFLRSDEELYRITSFDTKSKKPFPANVGMFYNLSDVRGYDSIIPKQYADFMELIEEQTELQFNRIARIRNPESLDSPLLDLLNVKYVLTLEEIANPNYTLVYDGEIKVYRNEGYLPRAFLAYKAKVVKPEEANEEMRGLDPGNYVVLEYSEGRGRVREQGSEGEEEQGSRRAGEVIISSYTPNEVFVEVTVPYTGFLVLTDSFFPGWRAYDRAEGGDEERELHIYRAYGNFRAVELGPGKHVVRFKYSPMSFKLGLFTSFIAGVVMVLLVGHRLWRKVYLEWGEESIARRVAKNTLSPMALSILNKAIDTVFAMLALRILGPLEYGKYYFAIVIVSWFEIFTNFGLNTLLTREVAKDRSQANRYLSNTTILRLFLFAVATPALLFIIFLWRVLFSLPSDTELAIVLLAIGLIPSGLATGLAAVFYAYEKMEYPATITTVTTLLKVSLGALALILGFGFVGLAGVSIVVNVITLSILLRSVVRNFFLPRYESDSSLMREMVGLSYPLMINHLLATLFFKVDVSLLQPMKGDRVVGLYGAAYKFIDGLQIIPVTFTVAVFPILSRYAESAKGSLLKAYSLAVKLLFVVALPCAIAITFVARELIVILGGGEYLPDSMIALQIMVWSIPLGFINSVTQYALIALNQQRFLTKAFLAGLSLNIIGNLLFIPMYSYKASAAIHIFSELALLVLFYRCISRSLTRINWLEIFYRPAMAGGLMVGSIWLLREASPLFALLAGGILYLLALFLIGTFSEEEMGLIKELLPFELKRVFPILRRMHVRKR